jgi:hypothetical protein
LSQVEAEALAISPWRWKSLLGLLAVGVVLAGCGNGSSDTASISLQSPAVNQAGVSNATVGCPNAGTTWLPLKWGNVPKGTKELNIYFGRYEYKGRSEGRRIEPTFGGLLVAVKPNLSSLPAAVFPTESFAVDYRALHACAKHPPGERILIVLFARPELGQVPVGKLSKAFATALTEEALGLQPRVEAPAVTRIIDDSLAMGQLTATFAQD